METILNPYGSPGCASGDFLPLKGSSGREHFGAFCKCKCGVRKAPPLHTPADFAVCWEQCEMTRRRGPIRRAGGGEVDEGTEQTDMRRDKHMNNEAAKPPLAVRFSGPPPFSLPSFSPRYRHPPLPLPHSPPSCLSLTLPPSVVPTPPPPFFFFFYLVLFTAVVPPNSLARPSTPLCLRKRKKTKTNPQCFDKVFCPKCLNK